MKKISSLSPISVLALVYSLFIVYGTLIPFNLTDTNFQKRMPDIQWIPFFSNDGNRTSFSDVVQNVMLFMPFGLFGIFSLNMINHYLKFVLVILSGCLLSFSVEFLQLFTTDRTTSITDLITNTIGTCIGILLGWFLKRIWYEAKGIHKLKQIIGEQAFLRTFFLLVIILVELFQPFDFSINVSLGFSKLKALLNNAFDLHNISRDDVFVFFLYSLFSYSVLTFVKSFRKKSYCFFSVILLLCMVVLIESVQFVIISRSPEVCDIIVGFIGVFAGRIFSSFRRALPVQLIFMTIYLIAVFCKDFYPFQLRETYLQMNWLPFISEYNQTTITSLSNVIETLIIYTFGGYFTINCIKKSTSMCFIFLLIFIMLIPGSELMQGWIKTRFPDVTDILLGYFAFFTGMYFGWKGEDQLRAHLIESINGNSVK